MQTAFDQLPDHVRAFAFGQQVVEVADAVAEKYALADSFPLVSVVKRVLQGEDPAAAVPAALREAGIAENRAHEAASDFAKLALKPVAEAVGDVDALIRGWEGDPDAPVQGIVLDEDEDEEEGEEDEEVPPVPKPTTPPPPQKPPETKVTPPPAPRPVSPPVPPKPAPPLVKPPVPTTTSPAKPAVPPAPKRPAPPAPARPAAPFNPAADLLAKEDEEEVARHAAKAEAVRAAEPPTGSLEADVTAVVQASGLTDAEQKKQLAKIVEARLRDVRDAYGTRAEIERLVGVKGRALADLMERLESVAYERRRLAEEKARQDKAAHVDRQAARRTQGDAVRAKEEQLLARRYAELTGKAPAQPVGAIGARATAAVSADAAISQAAKRIDADKVKTAVSATRPSAPRPPSGARPHMQDVRPVQRLSGPADELRLLTLADFRRLSKDPAAAATKVMDKADLLRQQGDDQWIAAVKAWRASPLNAWYVAATREALSTGTDVRSLSAAKRAAGADVPTDAELDAVIRLNAQLRF